MSKYYMFLKNSFIDFEKLIIEKYSFLGLDEVELIILIKMNKSISLNEKFSIDNETFDNYRDLVRYVTYNLEPGNHTIIYNITYKEETNIVKQTVIIEDLEQIKNN